MVEQVESEACCTNLDREDCISVTFDHTGSNIFGHLSLVAVKELATASKAVKYEGYLKRIAELKKVEAGTPKALNTPGKRALYNNLNQDEGLALRIDGTVKKIRPDGWRGVQGREQVIKAALYNVLQSEADGERIFLIIKAQREY